MITLALFWDKILQRDKDNNPRVVSTILIALVGILF
jgi:hypothetical protein